MCFNITSVVFFTIYSYYLSDLTFEEKGCRQGEAEIMLNKILAMESSPLFTQNVQFLEDRVKHWRSRYVNQRAPYHNPIYGTTSLDLPSESLPSPPLYTFPKLAFDPAIDGSEATWGVEDELGVMANVQAYFEVAHRVSFLL